MRVILSYLMVNIILLWLCMTRCEASDGGGGRAVAVGAVGGGGGGGSVVRSSSGPDPSRKTSDPKPSVPKESIKSTTSATSDGCPEYWHLDLHWSLLRILYSSVLLPLFVQSLTETDGKSPDKL